MKKPLEVSFKDNVLSLWYGGCDLKEYYRDTECHVWRKMPGMKTATAQEQEMINELLVVWFTPKKIKRPRSNTTTLQERGLGCTPVIALFLCLVALLMLNL